MGKHGSLRPSGDCSAASEMDPLIFFKQKRSNPTSSPSASQKRTKGKKEAVRGWQWDVDAGGGAWASSGDRGLQQDTSMVWLTWPSPSLLSVRVQACGRLPSAELALVRDAVRERARRVMLAEGTVGRDGTGCERPHGG